MAHSPFGKIAAARTNATGERGGVSRGKEVEEM